MKRLLILFLYNAAMAIEKRTNYLNHEFSENPGVFFERMDDIQYAESKWSVIVFWNAKKNLFPHNSVGNTITNLEMACREKEWPKQCTAIRGFATQVERKITRVKNEFDELMQKLADIKNIRKDLRMEVPRFKRILLITVARTLSGWALGAVLGYAAGKMIEKIVDLTMKGVGWLPYPKTNSNL